MTISLLDELIERAERLSPDQQLRLIAHLAENVRHAFPEATPPRKWREIQGILPYPIYGEDAQAWVSRSRWQADERRVPQPEDTP